MARRAELVVGLDVGTAKVAVVIGERTAEGVALRATGYVPVQRGLKGGVIIDLEATASAIQNAVGEAEVSASCQVHSALVTVGGGHICSFESHGAVPVRGGEVGAMDVQLVLQKAREVPLPADYQILQLLLRDFVLDGQEGIQNPLGMSGHRLEVRTHVLTGRSASVENVVQACRRASIQPVEIVWSAWAAAEAVLSQEEKELGVVVLDLGAGTTNFLVYHGGSLRFAGAIGIGAHHVTRDVAAGLQTSLAEAENLKRKWGVALPEQVDDEEKIEVPVVGGGSPRLVERRYLAHIIQARVEELIELAWKRVETSGLCPLLRCGVVLTGGGASLAGTADVASRITRQPVRYGSIAVREEEAVDPAMHLLHPSFAAALGLVRTACERHALTGIEWRSLRFANRVRERLKSFVSALLE